MRADATKSPKLAALLMIYTICTSHKTCRMNKKPSKKKIKIYTYIYIRGASLHISQCEKHLCVICNGHRSLQSTYLCQLHLTNWRWWTMLNKNIPHPQNHFMPMDTQIQLDNDVCLLVCALSKVHAPKLFLDLLARQQGRGHDRCGRLQNVRAEGIYGERSPIKETDHFAAPSSRSWSSTSPRAISSRSPGMNSARKTLKKSWRGTCQSQSHDIKCKGFTVQPSVERIAQTSAEEVHLKGDLPRDHNLVPPRHILTGDQKKVPSTDAGASTASHLATQADQLLHIQSGPLQAFDPFLQNGGLSAGLPGSNHPSQWLPLTHTSATDNPWRIPKPWWSVGWNSRPC